MDPCFVVVVLFCCLRWIVCFYQLWALRTSCVVSGLLNFLICETRMTQKLSSGGRCEDCFTSAWYPILTSSRIANALTPQVHTSWEASGVPLTMKFPSPVPDQPDQLLNNSKTSNRAKPAESGYTGGEKEQGSLPGSIFRNGLMVCAPSVNTGK